MNLVEAKMAKKYSRQEILSRLRGQLAAGKPLLMFGAGIGLTARCAEAGGADIVAVYSTSIYRIRGQPTLLSVLPYGNTNEIIRGMAGEILPVVKETPCIAGIGAHDPVLNMERFMDELLSLGFSGFTNEPCAGFYGPEFAIQLESVGLGFSREVELISIANRKDVFSVAWCFNPNEARLMAQAGADVIGAIVGVTVGGMVGAKKSMSMEEGAAAIRDMITSARAVKPDIIVLTHGGPFKDPQTAEYSILHSGADGFAAGSSGERLPTEQAVTSVTQSYKQIRLK